MKIFMAKASCSWDTILLGPLLQSFTILHWPYIAMSLSSNMCGVYIHVTVWACDCTYASSHTLSFVPAVQVLCSMSTLVCSVCTYGHAYCNALELIVCIQWNCTCMHVFEFLMAIHHACMQETIDFVYNYTPRVLPAPQDLRHSLYAACVKISIPNTASNMHLIWCL